jgi:hypothetical protein
MSGRDAVVNSGSVPELRRSKRAMERKDQSRKLEDGGPSPKRI